MRGDACLLGGFSASLARGVFLTEAAPKHCRRADRQPLLLLLLLLLTLGLALRVLGALLPLLLPGTGAAAGTAAEAEAAGASAQVSLSTRALPSARTSWMASVGEEAEEEVDIWPTRSCKLTKVLK